MSKMKELLADQIKYISDETYIPEEVVAAYFDDIGIYHDNLGEMKEDISEASYGHYEGAEEFARDLMDNFVDFNNEWWSPYIDFERMAKDLLTSDYLSIPHDGGIWIFRNI